MIMKANKQIGFIYKNEESIDKILKDGDVVFERGFLRERTSTTLPITFGGVGKDLKDYRVYGNTYQNSTTGKNIITGLRNSTSNYINFNFNKNMATQNMVLSGIFTYTVSNFTIFLQTSFGNESLLTYQSCTQNEKFSFDIQFTDTQLENIVNSTSTPSIQFYKTGGMSGIGYSKIMLRPSDTTADYEPYTNGASPNPDYPQEIVSCGDLITDTTNINYGKYKIPVNVRSDNLFDMNYADAYIGDNNGITYHNLNTTAKTGFIKCKPNTTYTIKKHESSNRFHVCDYPQIAVNNSVLNRLYSNNNSSECTVTTNSDAQYLYIYVSTGTEAKTPLMTVVEGSTVPDKYIPYYNETTNIYLDEPLRKIGEYSDYIDFINGKVIRNIDETVLNGSETWNKIGTISNHFMYFYSTLLDATAIKNLTKIMFSNKFKVYEGQLKYNVPVNTDSINISNNDDTQRLRILIVETRLPSYTTDNFKSWLQSNNVTVDYVLITPTEESITLPNIPTIDGNNTLNIETEITPSQVYIKYKSNT